jgi:hypothetical protein
MRSQDQSPPLATNLWRTVAQLVEVSRYKPEGRGLDFLWRNWNLLLT